jgi:hypothetical protein
MKSIFVVAMTVLSMALWVQEASAFSTLSKAQQAAQRYRATGSYLAPKPQVAAPAPSAPAPSAPAAESAPAADSAETPAATPQ